MDDSERGRDTLNEELLIMKGSGSQQLTRRAAPKLCPRSESQAQHRVNELSQRHRFACAIEDPKLSFPLTFRYPRDAA